ncbi:flavodoxin [Clostridium butyricum]|uniref:flavodoxin n=1 Tax=Clostridium butyricum TaxID=1492 RepID=UPI00168ADB62|nr:flavodoxin [Clostridium butyricum]MDB2151468.1 flavodoxin [Clostridium butyricum]
MKKRFLGILTCLIVFFLIGCGNLSQTLKSENATSNQESIEVESTTIVNKELVVYFSWSGNTAKVASKIQNETGADSFEIVPKQPYTEDYNILLDIAKKENDNKARPEIAGKIENIDDYDVIFLGFPNWWGDMPMIVYSFLDNYDLSGKIIAPFCTSGGSGFSNTLSEIKTLEPNANVVEGLQVEGSRADDSRESISGWLQKINMNK